MTTSAQRSIPVTWPILALFWLPLALMWLLMGIEQPVLNGVMARLPEATLSLAAFEVAFGIALVIESPIIQMLSAGTALVRGRRSYRQLLRFMHVLGAGLTVIHLTLSRPVVFTFLAGNVLGVPEHVIGPAREAFVILIPFAAVVGYRRLWQGSLIQLGETGVVAKTMIIRLTVTLLGLAVGIALVQSFGLHIRGSIVGAWSLMGGVFAGAGASWWFYRFSAQRKKRDCHDGENGSSSADDIPRSLRALLGFYVPLSLTSVMALVSRPILAFGIARSVYPVESLATWPVINGLLFLFTSVSLSYQEAVVAKVGDNQENEPVLRRFGMVLAAALTGLLLLLSVTGGARLWFGVVAGLPDELVELALPAMLVLLVMPIAVTGRSLLSGILVARERTGFLSIAVIGATITLLTLVVVLPRYTSLIGTVVAAVSFSGANVVQFAILWIGSGLGDKKARRMAT